MADDVEARLANERNVWFVTVRPDARPHAAPVWFVFVEGRFWIGTGAASVKVRNIGAQPAVSVALEDGDRPVCAEGRAVVHPTQRPTAVASAFMSKYGWDITRSDDADVGTIALIEVVVDRWLSGGPTAQ
jgi:F420H(2)-dependent biliverdin reductase